MSKTEGKMREPEKKYFFQVKQFFGAKPFLNKQCSVNWLFFCIIFSVLSTPANAYDTKQTIISRTAGNSTTIPSYVSVTDNRIDTCWNNRLSGEFIYDLGKDRRINRLSWLFPKLQFASPVDYDIYATAENSYSSGKKLDLKQWTKIVSRQKNIMREGRREKFVTVNARYILFKSIRGTHKKNLISIREFSVGYIPEGNVKELTALYSDGKIVLKWSPLKNIGEYRIYRSDSSQGKGFIITTSGPLKADRYVDSDIIPGKEYFYYVTALKDGWQGEKSNVVSVRTDNFTRTVTGWQPGISGRSTGRYGRMMLKEAREDYVENVIGLTVLPDRKLNPQLIFTTLRSPKADKLTKKKYCEGIYRNLYIREKLNLGSIVPCASVNARPQVNAASANWVTRKVQLKYPKNIGMTLYETLTFPGLLINLDCRAISLFRKSQAGTPKMFAYQSAKGLTVTKQKQGNILAAEMSEPWLIAWWGTVVKGKKIDIPMLLIFQRQPREIYKNSEFLNISFGAEKGGYLLIMPLYGIDKINTSGWEKGLPKKVVERARQWTRYSRSIPMNVEDSFKIDAEKDRVRIKYTYKNFLNIRDDWDTQSEKLCILPSIVGICYDYGYPVRLPSSVKSLDYPAEFGPLYGASGTDEIEYSIPGAKFIVDPGYRKKLADDSIVEKIRELIPENTVDFFLTRPENKTWCVWRMRHISPAITKVLDLYNLYPDQQTRDKLRKYAENYINAQQFYNSDTYYYYLDRLSGKTMNYSLGAELTKGNPYIPPWITSAGDYLFGESTALYALGKYYDFFDKKEELKKHWECIRYRLDGFILQNDWEIPAPGWKTLGRGTSMSDFNNLFLSGYTAYARMAKTAGDTNAYQLSMYLLARNMLLQFSHWKGQAYAYRHRPYFMNNTRANGSLEPGENQEVALLLRQREGYAWFISSDYNVSDSAIYFIMGVLTSHELAQFFNKYLHDEVAKYLYETLPGLKDYDPDVITHQEVVFRTLIYEKDKAKALNLYKKTGACKDFPLAPYTYSALYYANPIKIIPPPKQFVNKSFEKKLHAFPESADWKAIKDLSEYNLAWRIGKRNNSMKEFAIGEKGSRFMKLKLMKQAEQMKYMDMLDTFVFEIGKHKDADFRGLQEGASTSNKRRTGLRNHPVNISFSLDSINSTPFLLIDLVHLDPKSNTNFMIDLNGVKRGITLPMPEYMFWLMAFEVPKDIVSIKDREKLIAIPLSSGALKQGLNRLTITALGGVPVYYDWLGFGYRK